MIDLAKLFLPIQRIISFSNVEGIGNRTSIFLQGCNINCLYCHNPETIALTSPTAKQFSLADLLTQIKGAMPFIRGITVSGGEPTLYAKELTILFQEVHKLGLTCYIDSNGFFPYEAIMPLIMETDKFLFDIKGSGIGLKKLCFSKSFQSKQTQEVLQAQTIAVQQEQEMFPEVSCRPEAKNLTTEEADSVLSRNFINLKKLLPLGKVEEVRLVYIKGYYDEYETVRQIAEALQDYPEVLFKLIRVHSKGARGPKEVVQNMPKSEDVQALAKFAKTLGLTKQVLIM